MAARVNGNPYYNDVPVNMNGELVVGRDGERVCTEMAERTLALVDKIIPKKRAELYQLIDEASRLSKNARVGSTDVKSVLFLKGAAQAGGFRSDDDDAMLSRCDEAMANRAMVTKILTTFDESIASSKNIISNLKKVADIHMKAQQAALLEDVIDPKRAKTAEEKQRAEAYAFAKANPDADHDFFESAFGGAKKAAAKKAAAKKPPAKKAAAKKPAAKKAAAKKPAAKK